MKVIYNKEVDEYLRELVEILYDNGYLGFKDYAYQYVDSLIDEIKETIHIKLKKTAPDYFSKYGKGLYYSVFKKNNNTVWYVFFNYENDAYYIRYIGNNHNISQYL
jgi:hypothetical protein